MRVGQTGAKAFHERRLAPNMHARNLGRTFSSMMSFQQSYLTCPRAECTALKESL